MRSFLGGWRADLATVLSLGALLGTGCGSGASGSASDTGVEAGGTGGGGQSAGSGGATALDAAGTGGTPAGTGGASSSADAGPELPVDGPGQDLPAGAPAAGDYGTAAPMIAPNSEMAVTTLDGKVYVLGGYPSTRQTQRTLQIFDPVTSEWTMGALLPIPIHHPVTAGVNGKLYSLGGQTDMSAQPDTGRSFAYDPTTNMWTEIAAMPTARGGGGGAIIGDKIYVVGGRPPAGNAFEVYDVSDNAWTALAKLPTQFNDRNHLAAAAIGGLIYVAGGRYDGGSVGSPRTAALDVYDPAGNAWTSKKPMLRPRGGMAGVAAGGCLYVYGGEGSGIGEPRDVYPDHDVYNPVTDSWTALKRLPIPFHGVTGGAFVDGLIYMPGGGTTSGGNSGSLMHQTYRPAMTCAP